MQEEINTDSMLFQKYMIQDIEFKNRIVCAPHWTSFNLNAEYSQRYSDYLAARAEGGAGWVVTEPMATTQNSRSEIVEGLKGWEPEVVPNWEKLTSRIHSFGSRISLTIGHAGRNAGSSETGAPAWAPSPDPSVITREIPSEMTKEDIAFLCKRIRLIARNAVAANFDAIELQVTADYLFGSFLSPLTNYRSDEYGGPLENRMRALMQALEEIRLEVSRNILVGFRISADHMVKGGLTIEETVRIIQKFKGDSLIDFVSVIVGSYYSLSAITPSMGGAVGLAIDSAEVIRREVGIPVVVAGRIPSPEQANEYLKESKSDFIAFARPFIADPNWPKKILDGNQETIYPCLYCNQQCVTRLSQKLPLSCVQNPAAGKESLLKINRTSDFNAKHIVVIGGGPAGLESAVSMAKAGFRVTLIEKEMEIGGRVNLAASIPGREEWLNVLRPRVEILKQEKVTLMLGTEATSEIVRSLQPDGIVFAIGASPWLTPEYRGELKAGRFSEIAENEFLSLDSLVELNPADKKILIIDEVGRRSLVAIVEMLLKNNCEISVVTSFPYLGYPAMVLSQEWSIARETFKNQLLSVHPFSKVEKIDFDFSCNIVDLLSGKRESIGSFDHITLAFGDVAKKENFSSQLPVWKVGDCASPRDIGAALADGYRSAIRVKDYFQEVSQNA